MKCQICGEEKLVSQTLKVCVDCIRENFEEVKPFIHRLHPHFNISDVCGNKEHCNLCINKCVLDNDKVSICRLRTSEVKPDSKNAKLLSYYDRLPTNCVASWVCKNKDRVFGKNLAVFFYGCSFNCLFCQNYTWRDIPKFFTTVEELLQKVNEDVKCICFFGGDPSCQLDFSINFAKKVLEKNSEINICWETNGSFNPLFLEQILRIIYESKGCIKFDLKFFNENLNLALCGASNRNTLENFKRAVKLSKSKKGHFPMVVASTLLIPGYVDEREIESIAEFIASLDKDIPYTLLGFWPHFLMKDLPPTSWEFALRCKQICLQKGLRYVKIANEHILI